MFTAYLELHKYMMPYVLEYLKDNILKKQSGHFENWSFMKELYVSISHFRVMLKYHAEIYLDIVTLDLKSSTIFLEINTNMEKFEIYVIYVVQNYKHTVFW